MLDYKQKEFLAQHLILSSTSPCLSQKILNLTSAKDMWDAVKLDATMKSSLHQVNVLNQLQMMECPLSTDPRTHLAEVEKHFEKMMEHCEYLLVTNSSVVDSTYVSTIISSMPNIYRPTCKETSVCFLTSPLLSYSPPVHMYIPNTFVPSPGTIPKVQ
jgi:hypothetical protein